MTNQPSEDPVQIDGHLVTLDMRADRSAARAIAIYAGMTRHINPVRSARIDTAASWYLPAAETLYALKHDWDGSLENLLSDQPAGPRPTDFDLYQLARLLDQASTSEAATKLYLAIIPDLLPKLVTELMELRSRIAKTLTEAHRCVSASRYGYHRRGGDGSGLICDGCYDEDFYRDTGLPCETHSALDPEGLYRVIQERS